jgi:hypothetical protein
VKILSRVYIYIMSQMKCHGTTLKEKSCQNRAASDEEYCHLHVRFHDSSMRAAHQQETQRAQAMYRDNIRRQQLLDHRVEPHRKRFELIRRKLQLVSPPDAECRQCCKCNAMDNTEYWKVIIPELGLCIECFEECNRTLMEISRKNNILRSKITRKNRIEKKMTLIQDLTNMPNVLMNIIIGYWIE